MSNVITFAGRPKSVPDGNGFNHSPPAHYQEIAVYGHAGPLIVALARRTDEPTGLIHVVLLGASVGLEIIASLPDDEKGRAVADFVGPAVLRIAELAETEIVAQPEAC